ncbi:MAG: OmpA family protein, partial [Chitinophagales bacterium]|nr:OmpA family protein [Chitinophagales bacterium]
RRPDVNIRNYWVLSVMRASSVTYILVSYNKIDPKRITAAGHGEFFPVESNDTPEGRSKNRRIEIVLSPDLREIFKILDTVK